MMLLRNHIYAGCFRYQVNNIIVLSLKDIILFWWIWLEVKVCGDGLGEAGNERTERRDRARQPQTTLFGRDYKS
jgi:hypothetical protein